MIDDTDILKKCACGKSYTRNAWAALDYAGQQTDGEYNYELRLCACGSSLAVVLGSISTIPAPPPIPTPSMAFDAIHPIRPHEAEEGAVPGIDVNGLHFDLWPLDAEDGCLDDALLKDKYGARYKRLPHLDDADWLGFVDTIEDGDIISVSRVAYERVVGPVSKEDERVLYELQIDGGVMRAAFPELRAHVALNAEEADVVRLLAPEETYGRDGWLIRREAIS